MRRQRSTIRDVARLAGVSVTTVSHTFSGNGAVGKATQARVRAAASELGYHPDVVASGLRRSRLGVIGLVLRPAVGAEPQQFADVDYFPRFAGAAALMSLAHGYALMLVADPTVPDSPVTAYACDGIIITDPIACDPLVAALRASATPYSLVGMDIEAPGDPYVVGIAAAAITDRVMDHLVASGAVAPALIVGTDVIEWNAATEERYRERMRSEGRPEVVLRLSERAEATAARILADELRDRPVPPDAVYCLTSDHARALVDRFQERGVRVPEDVIVVCGSDAASLRSYTPTITAVDLQPEALGRQAVATLLQRLHPDLAVEVSEPDHGALFIRESSRRAG